MTLPLTNAPMAVPASAGDLASVLGPEPGSYWQREASHLRGAAMPPAELPPAADFAVCGGGLAGLTTAINLKQRRPEALVVLLEAQHVGFGASGRNGGLMSPLAAPAWLLTADRNPDHAWGMARLEAETAGAARWLMRHVPEGQVAPAPLDLEAKGRITDAGLKRVADTIATTGIGAERARDGGGRAPLRVRLPAHIVHPYRLVLGLARVAREAGVVIVEQARVSRIGQGEAGAVIELEDGRTCRAGTVVVSTNAYTKSITGISCSRAKPVWNYMIATEPLADDVAARLAPQGRFSVELNTAYVFYRLHGRRLILGGIEKMSEGGVGDLGVPEAVRRGLERQLRRLAGGQAGASPAIQSEWGGTFHVTPTDLPIIARSKEAPSVVLNVGYGGTGVALTLVCGRLASAVALGERYDSRADQRFHEILSATRLSIPGAVRFAGGVAMNLLGALVGSR